MKLMLIPRRGIARGESPSISSPLNFTEPPSAFISPAIISHSSF